jgi:hypothetical protein
VHCCGVRTHDYASAGSRRGLRSCTCGRRWAIADPVLGADDLDPSRKLSTARPTADPPSLTRSVHRSSSASPAIWTYRDPQISPPRSVLMGQIQQGRSRAAISQTRQWLTTAAGLTACTPSAPHPPAHHRGVPFSPAATCGSRRKPGFSMVPFRRTFRSTRISSKIWTNLLASLGRAGRPATEIAIRA